MLNVVVCALLSLHDVKKHTVYEMLPLSAFKGAVLLDNLCPQ